ncbi:MAG TPA: enoyl-CoA hydratase-related protein, partial [Polyangiaceae bacterium LLY-WYZ-15_(1-7)]|nr:enoyl-CoA hydratase-related protein [Polyangiaceae bacterium LLY-WYZ-15_(1-7)]
MSDEKKSALSIDERDDGVAILWMDVPGESMNTLKEDFAQEFAEAFAHLETNANVKAVVFASGKKGSFIAGANIDMLARAKSAAEASELSRQGQKAMDRIEAFPKPVVAAIDGACLGGGLEVALACRGR